MYEIPAKTRPSGEKLRTLRKGGEVPAVLYGPGVNPLSLRVAQGDFERAFAEAGESSLLRLLVEDDGEKKPFVVLIRDVQRDPVRGLPLHLDFHAVRLDEEIKIQVPLHFVGKAPIEERGEGVLVKELHELEVEALPENLPHEIEVDISKLDSVDSEITIADLVLPEGVRAVDEPKTVLVHGAALMSEEEISAIETSSDESVAEVEVVGEKEKEEESGEESADEGGQA